MTENYERFTLPPFLTVIVKILHSGPMMLFIGVELEASLWIKKDHLFSLYDESKDEMVRDNNFTNSESIISTKYTMENCGKRRFYAIYAKIKARK